jgi:chorismate mutase
MKEAIGLLSTTWDLVKACLESEREQVRAEIRAYPTPIPRCDAQFNHLIEKRERLFQELARLDAARSSEVPHDDAARVEAFIDSSGCLDDDAKLRLKSALSEGRIRPEIS